MITVCMNEKTASVEISLTGVENILNHCSVNSSNCNYRINHWFSFTKWLPHL